MIVQFCRGHGGRTRKTPQERQPSASSNPNDPPRHHPTEMQLLRTPSHSLPSQTLLGQNGPSLCGGNPRRKADRSPREAAIAHHVTADVSYSALYYNAQDKPTNPAVLKQIRALGLRLSWYSLPGVHKALDLTPRTLETRCGGAHL